MEHLRDARRRRLCALRLGLPQFPRGKDFEEALAELSGEDEPKPAEPSPPSPRANERRRGTRDSAAPATAALDLRFMALALALGRRGLGRTWPNPAVGAVVVKDGVIVGRGWTQPGGRPHAETEALRRAGKAARGATLYVTLEPCSHHGKTPPCVDAIIRAGIARVVSALEDPNPEVAGPGLRQAARARHRGRRRAWRRGRRARRMPAISAACATAARRCCSSSRCRPTARRGCAGRKPAAHHRRGGARARAPDARENDAILIGIGTVLSDDPHLTCRLPGMMERSPVRVVLDARLRIPLATAIVGTARETPTWVFATPNASPDRRGHLEGQGRRGVARRRQGRPARSRRGAQGAGRARHHAADGRGRADGCGGLRRGRSGRRGGAVPLAESDRARASTRWRACR